MMVLCRVRRLDTLQGPAEEAGYAVLCILRNLHQRFVISLLWCRALLPVASDDPFQTSSQALGQAVPAYY